MSICLVLIETLARIIEIDRKNRGERNKIEIIDSETEILMVSKKVRLVLTNDDANFPANITVKEEMINGIGLW